MLGTDSFFFLFSYAQHSEKQRPHGATLATASGTGMRTRGPSPGGPGRCPCPGGCEPGTIPGGCEHGPISGGCDCGRERSSDGRRSSSSELLSVFPSAIGASGTASSTTTSAFERHQPWWRHCLGAAPARAHGPASARARPCFDEAHLRRGRVGEDRGERRD